MNILTLSVDQLDVVDSHVLKCQKIQLHHREIVDGNNEGKESSYHYALLLGLPCEASRQELENLLEPMKNECDDIIFLLEETVLNVEDQQYKQQKCFCLAKFAQIASRNIFCTVYNNMPMAPFKECAPCIALPITRTLLKYDMLQHHKLLTTYPIFIPILSQDHVSMSRDRKLLSSPMKLLPTCSLCVRRLRNNPRIFLKSADHHTDEQQIIVGRSFTHDPLLSPSFDLRDGVDTRTIPGLLQQNLMVRCMVCFVYHYVQTPAFQRVKLQQRSLMGSKSNGDGIYAAASSSSASASAADWSPLPVADMSTGMAATDSLLGSCYRCKLLENIWTCLICGYTGCGRYTAQHAYEHYYESQHPYALELVSGRIWDYLSDEFVHHENSSSAFGGILQHFTQYSNLSAVQDLNYSSDNSTPMIPDFTKSIRVDLLVDDSSTNNTMEVVSIGKVLVSEDQLQEQQQLNHDSLTHGTLDKLNSMSAYYETLIETQLQDQQLYYEKLLARETVRAMEYSLLETNRGKRDGKLDKSSSMHNGKQSSKNSSVRESTVDWSEEQVDRELEEMEQIKLQISQEEEQLRTLLEEMKAVEQEAKIWKKENEKLLLEQRQSKDQIAELIRQKCLTRKSREQQIEDLKQQIVDFEFYISTKMKMEASPLKEELEGATLVTQVKEPVVQNTTSRKKLNKKNNS